MDELQLSIEIEQLLVARNPRSMQLAWGVREGLHIIRALRALTKFPDN